MLVVVIVDVVAFAVAVGAVVAVAAGGTVAAEEVTKVVVPVVEA